MQLMETCASKISHQIHKEIYHFIPKNKHLLLVKQEIHKTISKHNKNKHISRGIFITILGIIHSYHTIKMSRTKHSKMHTKSVKTHGISSYHFNIFFYAKNTIEMPKIYQETTRIFRIFYKKGEQATGASSKKSSVNSTKKAKKT